MKKKKNVKKYAVGGDLRMAPPSGMNDLDPGGMVPPYMPYGGGGGGGGGIDDTATGQVKQVSKSAARAAERLKGAGQAQQQAGSMLGNSIGKSGPMLPDDPVYSPYSSSLLEVGGSPFKGGGKVKKPAKKRVKKNMGGMMNYSNGGKVRGVGRAVQKKIRPAKMVSMKGS